MKKSLLYIALLLSISKASMAQNIPAPVYSHHFTSSLSATDFTVNSSGNALSADRNNRLNRAAALSSNHASVYVDIQDHKTDLLTEGTVSLWFKYAGTGFSAFGSDKPLVFWSNGNASFSEGVVLAVSNIGTLKVLSYENSVVGGYNSVATNASNGEWHHFTVTWKFGQNGYIRAYLDGVRKANYDLNHTLTASALDEMFFTGFSNNYPSALYGNIDEINIFTQALDDTLVEELYTSCIVNIPDNTFKTRLVDYPNVIDRDGDGEIQCHEAAWYNQDINVGSYSISDLTGLEAFTSITSLICSNTDITTLDVSTNTKLTTLTVDNTNIPTLDVSNNTDLEFLSASHMDITSLDVSNNRALKVLECYNSKITSLDLSRNPALTEVVVYGNELTNLNVANTTNRLLLNKLRTFNNPNLSCIQVDNAAYSNTNWTGIDYEKSATTSYSEDCSGSIGIDKTNAPLLITVAPNPTTGKLHLSETADVQIYDMSGRLLIKQDNATSIDLSEQVNGVYILKVTNPTSNGYMQIIKQ